MTSKIDFYREVLTDDPNSRVFFPLARMLGEAGQAAEAVDILKRSIVFHPGHLEAKFLMVELLSRLGREEEALQAFEGLSQLLSNYPAVWSLWASKASGLSREAAVALRFLALSLQGQEVSWLSVMEKGLGAPHGRQQPLAQPHDVAVEESLPEEFSLRGADEVMAITQQIEAQERRAPAGQLPPECASRAAVKTRTMADLLARHGDYSAALDIYGELLRLSSSEQERAVLAGRIRDIETQAVAGAAPGKQALQQQPKTRTKLVSMLEALANRLDARATA